MAMPSLGARTPIAEHDAYVDSVDGPGAIEVCGTRSIPLNKEDAQIRTVDDSVFIKVAYARLFVGLDEVVWSWVIDEPFDQSIAILAGEGRAVGAKESSPMLNA